VTAMLGANNRRPACSRHLRHRCHYGGGCVRPAEETLTHSRCEADRHTWRAASIRTMLASLIFFVSELPAERARRIEEAKALRERYGGVTERRSQSAHEAIIVARRTVAIMGARRGALGHFVLPQQSGL
jgi:hypothetical protein